MKKNNIIAWAIVLMALAFCFAGCATQKDGCGTEHYRRKFTVINIRPTVGSDRGWTVELSPRKLLRYMRVPDSIRVGKEIFL